MPLFAYEAMNSSGQEVKDEIEAASSEEAISKIRGKGYFPTKVREKAGKKSVKKKKAEEAGPITKKRKMPFAIGGVPQKTLVTFTRQLSTLQDAGLPILRSLQILEQQQRPGLMKAVIGGVADEVEGGGTLSDAMAQYPKAFNKLYVNMINAGEAGGVLDIILNRLADFMEKAAKLKKKVIGAMIYPAVVIFIAVAIVSMILIFVVPKFKDIFKDFKLELPAVTQLLITFSTFMAEQYGWAYIFFGPIILALGWRLIRMSDGGRYASDLVLLKVPILGSILAKTAVARFTRTLGTLISAGVPILDAINITKETCGNEVYSRALAKVHDAIREGESMADPLRATKVCDAIVVNMVDVGEETGDLDKMLMKVADNYDSDVDVLVGSLISILEPVMVVVLGVIVGFIVIALFMPMVSLIQGISGPGKKSEVARLPAHGRAVCPCKTTWVITMQLRKTAFTLVELLVVIGIIVILIGLLIPVASRVRITGQEADSRALIQALDGAIQAYSNTFRAYPGPIPNNLIANSAATATSFQPFQSFVLGDQADNNGFDVAAANNATLLTNITGAENLVLGLLGGLRVDGTDLKYEPSQVGQGPASLNPGNPKRTGAFIDTKDLSFRVGSNGLKTGKFQDEAAAADDSIIPEFVDRFTSGPMPVLYLRARPGAKYDSTTAIAADNNGVINQYAIPADRYDGKQQYDLSQVIGYTGADASGNSIGQGRNARPADYVAIPTGATSDKRPHGLRDVETTKSTEKSPPTGFTYEYPYDGYAYFLNPTQPNTPRQKDGYILISAGRDRVYGTNDDITNFGPVK